MDILNTVLLIIGVILLFNIMIFVHELGHFFAARWRGLYVDKFQIWFGKAIWKKTINGVQWGLGWIPAGGFVSLPQMAPMESLEGESDLPDNLPSISAKDKIIVAFAGPLFSFLLALFFAVIVWIVGRPDAELTTTTIGYIPENAPAAKVDLRPGDKIIAVDGVAVNKWVGNMEGVRERIMLGEKPVVSFTIEREGTGEPLVIDCPFTIPETKWWERRAMRQVGIMYASDTIAGESLSGSPAEKAGIKEDDRILTMNGKKLWSPYALMVEAQKGQPIIVEVQRGKNAPMALTVKPELPVNASEIPNALPMLGLGFKPGSEFQEGIEHPTPWTQVGRSLRWMKLTVEKIFSSGSDVGVQHLAGPIGIGTQLYNLLAAENGWQLALWFAVVLNINLAILNLLPIPVVDGGHIVLGLFEWVRGRPMNFKVLEVIQSGFAFVLIGMFIFVTSKDVGDLFGSEKKIPEPTFVQEK